MSYTGRGAVVTGAASGIGFATAAELARRGAKVLLADIDGDAVAKAAEELRDLGEDVVLSMRCDVGVAADIDALADRAFDALGTVDLMFNNAGVGVSGAMTELGRADWDWVMGVNLWGPMQSVKAFVPRMVAQERPGHMLFNASFAGLVYDGGLGPYCVSKAGVIAMAEVLRQELRGTKIGVSVVCPMRVDTEIGSSSRNRAADDRAQSVAKDVTDPRDDTVPGKIIPADTVALQILDALDHGELYIMTHGEGRYFLARRFERIDRMYERQHPNSRR